MSKEYKILSQFFTFLVDNQEHLQLQEENSEDIIQKFCKIRNEEAEKLKEEKRLNRLKKLELLEQRRSTQAHMLKQQIIPKEKQNSTRPTLKEMKKMRDLIDRIRN